jgi:RecA-family ATPase
MLWTASARSGDENSAKDMGRLIDQVEWLKKNLGAAALIIHHTGKDGLRERGSSVLRAVADVMRRFIQSPRRRGQESRAVT